MREEHVKQETPMWEIMGCANALEWEGKKWFDKREDDYNILDTIDHEGSDEYL